MESGMPSSTFALDVREDGVGVGHGHSLRATRRGRKYLYRDDSQGRRDQRHRQQSASG